VKVKLADSTVAVVGPIASRSILGGSQPTSPTNFGEIGFGGSDGFYELSRRAKGALSILLQ